MAKTDDLLGLIDEFSEAFSDPDLPIALPPKPAIAKLEKEVESSPITVCQELLNKIKDDSKLMAIAEGFLQQLAMVDELKQSQGVIEFALRESKAIAQPVLQLEETYAREGSLDCPSGMCPLDH
jgi:hypothetical protein